MAVPLETTAASVCRWRNREKLNDIGGAAIGAVNGVCFGILLCWALQFAGPVIGCDTLAHTALSKALQAIDVLTLGASV
mgnify:CR=1 FL=1